MAQFSVGSEVKVSSGANWITDVLPEGEYSAFVAGLEWRDAETPKESYRVLLDIEDEGRTNISVYVFSADGNLNESAANLFAAWMGMSQAQFLAHITAAGYQTVSGETMMDLREQANQGLKNQYGRKFPVIVKARVGKKKKRQKTFVVLEETESGTIRRERIPADADDKPVAGEKIEWIDVLDADGNVIKEDTNYFDVLDLYGLEN